VSSYDAQGRLVRVREGPADAAPGADVSVVYD
jgi:YD repeat-containing protein